MPTKLLTKSVILMVALVAISVISWEFFLRSQGYKLGYNDDEALWAKNRAQVYSSPDRSTVFIGSSRIKFDLDIPTWEQKTGEDAVQLAMHGSCPLLALENLGEDEKFKGKLVVDVTEGLFFKKGEDDAMKKRIKYLKDATPSEKVSAKIGMALESVFLFIDKENFSLGAFLDGLRIPDRQGVRGGGIFPKKFSYVDFQRQEIMTDEFTRDTNMQKQVTDLWSKWGALSDEHGITGDTLQKIFDMVETAVKKINERGGKVVFVRTPSSGGYGQHEPVSHPRSEYFDKLLEVTGSQGIHFLDYPETKNFICPEWSHLSKPDAVKYTIALTKIMEDNQWFTTAK